MEEKLEHPGIVVFEMFKAALAKMLDLKESQLELLFRGKIDINQELATKLENAFGLPKENFINMQIIYDNSLDQSNQLLS